MSKEGTPEERLREYKKRIAQMASEDRKEEEDAIPELPEDTDQPKQTEIPGPPKNLQSPAKQELRSSLASRRTRGSSTEESPHKTRMMLRARELAIEGSLQDIKDRKERLELLFKRKMISREEFERRRKEIVREGQELLREKAEVDAKLSR